MITCVESIETGKATVSRRNGFQLIKKSLEELTRLGKDVWAVASLLRIQDAGSAQLDKNSLHTGMHR